MPRGGRRRGELKPYARPETFILIRSIVASAGDTISDAEAISLIRGIVVGEPLPAGFRSSVDDVLALGRLVGNFLAEHPGKLHSTSTVAEFVGWSVRNSGGPKPSGVEALRTLIKKGRE